jgi:hypothetical protein
MYRTDLCSASLPAYYALCDGLLANLRLQTCRTVTLDAQRIQAAVRRFDITDAGRPRPAADIEV